MHPWTSWILTKTTTSKNYFQPAYFTNTKMQQLWKSKWLQIYHRRGIDSVLAKVLSCSATHLGTTQILMQKAHAFVYAAYELFCLHFTAFYSRWQHLHMSDFAIEEFVRFSFLWLGCELPTVGLAVSFDATGEDCRNSSVLKTQEIPVFNKATPN